MEDWAIVAIVLGTTIITNLLTWFLTNRQLKSSDKRLERQLEARREEDKHERRREVRSQPLLELRLELACVAARQGAMIDLVAQLHDGASPNEKKTKEQLKKAVEDWEDYCWTAKLDEALYMQDDYKLATKVDKIQRDYQKLYYDILDGYLFDTELDEKVSSNIIEEMKLNNKMVIQVQELINKKLEEL